jgi:hypothetical protein
MLVNKIVSGGQTGVDCAALDVAPLFLSSKFYEDSFKEKSLGHFRQGLQIKRFQ